MDGNHVVLEISSDEDVGFDWPATDGCDSEIDWTELFVNLERDASDSQDRENGYDSDEVVVVKEVFAKPKRTTKSSGVANLAVQHPEEDDDDCVILDGDPDKPVAEDKNSGYDSDDLVIVAEKGQVACRDYPHPRHLCVQFSFTSTLHSEHCSLCHCYVCDSPAPCGYWGNGNSVTDHCHATEKEELWKSMRKQTKQAGISPVASFADRPFWNDSLYPIPNVPLQTLTFDPPNIIRSQKSGLSGRVIACSNKHHKARVSSISSHSVTSSPIHKRPRLSGRARLVTKEANTWEIGIDHRDGDLNSPPPYQNSSAVNTSKMSAGPTPSQGQVTQAQLYGQRTSRANGNLNENISSPVSSNPQCKTSQQFQSFTGLNELQVLADEDCPWTHF